jgi:hypothetical protein
MKRRYLTLLLFPLASPAQEVAQSAPASETVVIKGVRDPAIMPYRDAYEFANRIDRVPHEKVRVQVQLKSQNKAVKPADIRVHLAGDNIDLPVPIGEEGAIEIPRSPEALADGAEFVTNQKKGSVAVAITLFPNLPATDRIAYADAFESAEQARRLIKEIVPWYYRLLIADPNALRICFERAGGEAVLLTRQGDETLPIKGRRQCVRIALERGRLGDWESIRLTPPYKLEFSHRSWFSDGIDD